MRSHAMRRGRLVAACMLGTLAGFVPTANADTTLPVWTCRASAAYVESEPLLGTQRVEPVLANGFPSRTAPDAEVCATQNTGVQNIDVPEGESPLLSLQAASASTEISPEIGAARDQTASADAGIAETVRVNVGDLTIDAELITATAEGKCVGGEPQLTGSSTIVALSIGGQPPIPIPDPGAPFELDLGVAKIALNQRTVTTAPNGDQKLTQQAAVIEVPSDGSLARVVLGEAQVDFHGDVCAAEVVPTCPAGTVAQDPDARPLVCILEVIRCAPGSAPGTNPNTCVLVCPEGSKADPNGGACVREVAVAAPCPAGSTADPARGGACVVTVQAPPANCPSGTTREPATNNCVLVRDRPCPAGSAPDPATRVCVQRVTNNVTSGENGRIGSATGPRATCGRLDMFFVRGGFRSVGRSFTSQFGTRTVTRGRLVTCGSNPRPIIGARVDVVHVLPGNKRRRKTGLRSRANGRLTLILPIDLRSRTIEYAYRPDLRSTRVTSRIKLRLTVRSRSGRTLR